MERTVAEGGLRQSRKREEEQRVKGTEEWEVW